MAMNEFQEKYAVFFTDFMFSRLFAEEDSKELLASFLNALLEGEERIRKIEYIPSEQLGLLNKSYMFNALCETDKGDCLIIEMQKAEQQFYINRSELFSSFSILKHTEEIDWHRHPKAIYAIGILNFSFDDADPMYFHHEILRSSGNDGIKRSCIFQEIPKFKKKVDELENLMEKWMYAIRNLTELNKQPDELSEDVFYKFFQLADKFQFSPTENSNYMNSLKH